MQVQLHPLISRCVQALGGLVGKNGDGVQHHLIVKPIDHRLGQYLHPSAHGGGIHNGLGFG